MEQMIQEFKKIFIILEGQLFCQPAAKNNKLM